MWFFIEINLLTFISFLNFNNCKFQSQARVKYFIVQALVSGVILLIILLSINTIRLKIKLLFRLAILVKLGAAPFQIWFISVILKLNWISIFWISTIQKFIPLLILRILVMPIMWIFIFIRFWLASLPALNQINFKKLLGVSSVFRVNWLVARIIFRKIFWIKFIFVYGIIVMGVVLVNLKLINRTNKKLICVINFFDTNLIFISLLALAGIPPLAIFFIKLNLLIILSQTSLIMSALLILFSVVIIFMYIGVTIKFLLKFNTSIPFTSLNFIQTKYILGLILLLRTSYLI